MKRKYAIVEVEGYQGEEGSVVVNDDPEGLTYCIAVLDIDQVWRFVDWGYPTSEAAREAWPNLALDKS